MNNIKDVLSIKTSLFEVFVDGGGGEVYIEFEAPQVVVINNDGSFDYRIELYSTDTTELGAALDKDPPAGLDFKYTGIYRSRTKGLDPTKRYHRIKYIGATIYVDNDYWLQFNVCVKKSLKYRFRAWDDVELEEMIERTSAARHERDSYTRKENAIMMLGTSGSRCVIS